MRTWSVAPLVMAAFAAAGTSGGTALADQAPRVSGPNMHENLAVYFVHASSAAGPVPLTLQEALAKGSVQLVETGQVNELKIENTGAEEVFIQAGDIVKGGRQDRVLTVSFLLPARSGQIPVASFCVEQGRWSARGKEDQFRFSSAHEAMPNTAALLAMAAPPTSDPAAGSRPSAASGGEAQRIQRMGPMDETASKQRKVWDSVATTQNKLASGLNARVAAPESATSLQLSLENAKLKEARAAYIKALEPAGLEADDVVGYIVAINGKLTSASIYPSNALFRKMWSKQLAASVTEAIGEKPGSAPAAAPPPAPKASEFLQEAEKGQKHERAAAAGARLETRDADKSLYNEARSGDGRWVHKSYLAK